MYVRGFQLISRIQHAILQIWVCMRKGYANERVCEKWVWLGECVRGVEVEIRDWSDMLCGRREIVCDQDYSPVGLYVFINPYEWTRYSFSLKTHTSRSTRLHYSLLYHNWLSIKLIFLYLIGDLDETITAYWVEFFQQIYFWISFYLFKVLVDSLNSKKVLGIKIHTDIFC